MNDNKITENNETKKNSESKEDNETNENSEKDSTTVSQEIVVQEEDIYIASIDSGNVNNVETLIAFLNNIPKNIYKSTMDLTHNISARLRHFGNVVKGDDKDSKRESAVVVKTHFELLERLRLYNPSLYDELVVFSQKVQGLKDDTKNDVIKAWFRSKLDSYE